MLLLLSSEFCTSFESKLGTSGERRVSNHSPEYDWHHQEYTSRAHSSFCFPLMLLVFRGAINFTNNFFLCVLVWLEVVENYLILIGLFFILLFSMGTLSKPKLGCAVQNWSKFDKLFTLYFLLLKSDLLLLHLHLHLHLLLLRAAVAVAVVKAPVA